MMPYGGKRPELGWSVHMTGGWESQWNRVQRWYNRANAAQSVDDRYDFLYAFLEAANHLRDWLQDTNAVSQGDLNSFFKKHVEMRLCRDLANAHKHLSLTHKPSQPNPPSEAHEYVPGAGNLSEDVSLVILSDGTKYDAFDLARRILALWRDFLTLHKI